MTYNTGSILYLKVFTTDQFSSKVKVEVSFKLNTYNAVGKFSRWQIDDTYSYFSQKSQILFSNPIFLINKKNTKKCCLLNFLPSMLSI